MEEKRLAEMENLKEREWELNLTNILYAYMKLNKENNHKLLRVIVPNNGIFMKHK